MEENWRVIFTVHECWLFILIGSYHCNQKLLYFLLFSPLFLLELFHQTVILFNQFMVLQK